jgi:hypothetical protein
VSGLTRFLKQQGQLVSTTGGSTLMTALSHALLYLSFRLGRTVSTVWWGRAEQFWKFGGVNSIFFDHK